MLVDEVGDLNQNKAESGNCQGREFDPSSSEGGGAKRGGKLFDRVPGMPFEEFREDWEGDPTIGESNNELMRRVATIHNLPDTFVPGCHPPMQSVRHFWNSSTGN